MSSVSFSTPGSPVAAPVTASSSPTPSESTQATNKYPGQILHLELHNFKSYRGTQVIGPFKQFSCIIGPNGSGKSNLMDAISFVMGLRAQHLRSTKLSKLIYHGDSTSAQTQSTPQNAYVKLVFETPERTQMEFKRQVNGEGQSTYYIDNRSVSATAYDQKLESFGVLSKARNFLVFQGDVESIASKSPMELTRLIEKVSKSDEFKKEYERLKAKKESASELVVQNFQKKKTVNQEKTKYKLHKKEAEEFEKLAQQHSKKQTTYVLWRLYHIESKIQENLHQHNQLQVDSDQYSDQIQALNTELATHKRALAKARAELMKKNGALKKQQKSHRRLETDTDRINVNLKHSQSTIEKIEKQLEDASRSNEERQREIQRLESEIKRAEKERDEALAEIRSKNPEEHTELTGDLLDEYNELKKEIGKQTINLREDLQRNQAVLDTEREEVKQISARVQLLTEKLETNRKYINAKEERHNKMVSAVQSKEDEKQALKKEYTQNQKTKIELEDEQTTKREQLTRLRDSLRDARVEEDENQRDQKMNQALESMKNHFSGVYGRITDLFDVSSRRYEIPVFVALGNRNRSAIVTDTEKTAIECIKYLKEQRVPPMVFIPLDTIQAPKLRESLRNIHNTNSKLVMDVVTVRNPQYEPALRYALGNTVLFRDMETAMRVLHEHREKLKCVTEDGTIFSKSGFITGGKAEIEQALRAASSQRTKKAESEVAKLKEDRDALVQRLSEITQDMHKLEKKEQKLLGDIQNREHALKFLYHDAENAQTDLEQYTSEEKRLQEAHTSESKAHDVASKKVQEVEAKIEEITGKISEIEDEIMQDFNTKIGYNMREYEHERQAQKQQLVAVQTKYGQIISRLTESLAYTKSLFKDDEALQKLKDDLAEEQKHEKQLSQDLKKNRKQLQTSQKKTDEVRASFEEAKRKAQEEQTRITESINRVQDAHYRLQSLQKKLTNVSNAVNILRSKRSQLATQCLVEEIELPRVDSGESTRPKKRRRHSAEGTTQDSSGKILRSEAFEIEIAGAEEEEEEEEDVMRDIDVSERTRSRQQTMALDFSALDDEICQVTSQEQYQKIEEEFKTDLSRLINEIEKLAPSVKSSKRYEGVKEKLNKTSTELEKAKEESKKAAQDFEAVKEKRYQRFMSAFTPISKAIDGIYKELTKSETVPLGGTAYLGLEQEDEPYLQGIKYNAMPPLKRYRDIDQLSGGERTVAALALLFAIHRHRPSPFFILDEVDAALDNVNVNKVAHYIHRSALKKDCQFIVISLKENFFATGDSLVGVCKDQEQQSSSTLSMDLSVYRGAGIGMSSTQQSAATRGDTASEGSVASSRISRASSGHVSDI